MHERPRHGRIAGVVVPLALALAVVSAACGSGKAVARGPTRPASAWSGQDATLFDDGLDVGALAPPGTTTTAEEDSETAITNRTYAADGVVLAKVIGVSSEPVGDKNRYRLELTIEGDALAGAKPESPFTLKVGAGTPSYGTVRSQDAQLIGKKFVVFYRRYADEEGADEPITHFHLSGNNERVLGVIRAAMTRKKVEGG